jgi:hypothetical protein
MMLDIVFLASHFKSGDFFMDVIAPAIAGVVVLLLIGNSLLKHFGYQLF